MFSMSLNNGQQKTETVYKYVRAFFCSMNKKTVLFWLYVYMCMGFNGVENNTTVRSVGKLTDNEIVFSYISILFFEQMYNTLTALL